MSLSRRLDDLQNEVLLRADIQDCTVQLGGGVEATGLANLNLFINASIRRLYRMLVSANLDLYLTSATVAVTAGEGDLPATFWRCEGVEAADGSEWRQLRRWSFSERNKFAQSNVDLWQAGYRIVGGKLRLFPPLTGSIRLWFIPVPTTLALAADTFDGIAGYEDWAILDAAIRLKQKFEEDCTELLADRQVLEAEIRASASERDDAEPDRIRDVESEADDDLWAIMNAST